jgi:hypothetical protein
MEPTLRTRSTSLKAAALLTISLAPAMQAQTFRNIPELTFTRQFGAPNPLPQILTVASTTAAAIRFTVATSTSSGGNWLAVAGCPATCDTPHTLTVSIGAGVTLAAGTYTGQIVLTEFFSSATTMTIPVTLTIAPGTDPILDNLPGHMSFSLKTNGLTPPSQPLNIRNAGTSTLTWSLVTSTSDGGSWLTASATSGTAPSMISISIVKANLPGAGLTAGTFVGHLRFNAGGRSTTVPVSVVVGADVYRQINAISFSKTFGGADPLPQELTIVSTGAAIRSTVTASVARGGDWLTVTGCPSTCDTVRTITVSVNPLVTLAVGTYTGQVEIREFFGGNMSITVPVTLTVVAAGGTRIDNLPGQMSFLMLTGGVAPTSRDVEVRNAISGALTWTVAASTSDGAPWLVVTPSSGSTPSFVTVSISLPNLPDAGLTPGTFTGQLVFQHLSGNVTIPVNVVVGSAVFRQVNPLHFTKVFGGANPLPQTLTIPNTSTSATRFTVTASTATGGTWLSVSGCPSTCDTPEVITASIAAAPTLPVGTYTGQILVREFFAGEMSMTIPVTLTVLAPGSAMFDNMPGQLSFAVKKGIGGAIPPAPPGQDIHVRNAGSGSLAWTLSVSTSDGGSWLMASASSGSTPSTVRISIDPNALPDIGLVAGSFVGEVVFSSAAGRVTVPVSVTVGDDVLRQVNPISFVKPQAGADPLPQILTISSTGTAAIRAVVRVSTATGGDWLTVTGCPSTCDTPTVLRAIVNAPVGLAAGTYTGQIVVEEFFAAFQAITIPVTLTVAPGGGTFFDNVQGQLGFSMVTAGSAPGSMQVELRNAGIGTLAWTLERSTADSGSWLNVSTASGSTAAGATSAVTVSVVPAALPDLGLVAGTFTGQILFKSSAGNMTIPVSVAVGANVFNQLGPLHFTRGFGGSNPLPQTLSLTSTGAAIRATSAEFTGNGGDWLSISGCPSTCDTPSTITASVTAPSNLAAGTYTGQIVFTEFFGTDMAHTVPVILTITGSPCTYGISPTSANAAATGATGSVTVTPSSSGCAWTATSNAAWITVTSGASGTGNGSVGYSVAANSGAARSGTVTIGGQTFTVNQAEAGCALGATSATHPYLPGTGSVTVGGTGCTWTATSNAAWITISSGASGTGSGTVGYSFTQNNGAAARVGTITIADHAFTVTQNALTISMLDPNPTSGTGSNRTFVFTFSDTGGAADLTVLNVLVNNALDARNACYIAYVRSINTVVLVNDAGDAGGPFVGALAFPTTSNINNSQCTIHGSGSGAVQSGNTVILTLNITFSAAFPGRRVMWAAGRDASGDNTGWLSRAVWQVPGPATDPAVVNVTPTRASAGTVTISTTFTDSAGFADLSVLNLLINNAVDGRNACYLAYIRSINTLVLVNDAGDAGGPFAAVDVLPGTNPAMSNSQCSINAVQSSVTTAGNQLTLNLRITFTAAFSGDRIIYAAARDNGAGNSGWQAVGTVTVP